MVEQPVRSLEIVAKEVKSERQMQLTHFDSLDSKAGIVLASREPSWRSRRAAGNYWLTWDASRPAESVRSTVTSKAPRLKLSMLALAVATVLTAAGLAIH